MKITVQGQKLTLPVGVDGSSNTMYNTWIHPLRRQGFPTTFVIDQQGKIAWIDVNIDRLDWVLGEVLARKWDLAKSAAIMNARDSIEDKLFQAFKDDTDSTNRN